MPDEREGTPPCDGQVVTFYSFKGGTGRTMALANVAWILAANGKRVLAADWDLESPGLHRFFQPFLDTEVSENPGIIDFVREYEWAADAYLESLTAEVPADSEEAEAIASRGLTRLISERAKVQKYTIPVRWDFPAGGSLSLLFPGKQNSDYKSTLSALAWDNFYDQMYGAAFFDALRMDMKQQYDYVLIDSRTGLSDIADICTLHLPDALVDCFTLSTQGIEGAARIADLIQARQDRAIRILPVPMRIDQAEHEKAGAGLAFAADLFQGLPAGMTDIERRQYWAAVEVPYRAFYAYEEILAVFGDIPGSPATLLASFERITSQITRGEVTRLPDMEASVRERNRRLFARQPLPSAEDVYLDFSPEDQLWAEWITAVLAGAGIRVRWADQTSVPKTSPETQPRVVAVVSQAYRRRMREAAPAGRLVLAVSVSEARVPHEFDDVPVLFLAGLPEDQAAASLLDKLDGERMRTAIPADVRYPGGHRRQILRLPARNVNFTGRENDLRRLREELRAGGGAVGRPVILQGLGGVGKTQVAVEYAHRFMADYDVIWFMNCGQAQYIDASLADLGKKMREVFEAGLPEEGSVAEVASQVLQLLSDTRTEQRWLLVYDNADEIEAVQPLLPTGHGHVLITSPIRAWSNEGQSLPVEVFTRAESIRHLQQRLPRITAEEADQVAEALGDLPLAVAAAGAWLAETGMGVPAYLEQLSSQPASLSFAQLADYPRPVAQAWDLSLNRLQETAPAAARLFSLCSVMAPDISLELIYSKAMAAALAPLDSDFSEPMIIGTVIRRLDRLALIKLDTSAHQIVVHRLLQAVVRERMSAEEMAAARRDVHQLLVAARPDSEVDDPAAWTRYRLIWPHLTPSGAMWSQEELVRQLLIDRVRYLRQRGDLERGRRRAQEIEGAWEQILSTEADPAITGSVRKQLFRLRFNLANIIRDLAEFTQSQALDVEVLAGQRDMLGDKHPHTLMTASSLAADLRALGQYHEALAQDRVTYETWTSEFGDDYPGTLAAANNLALSLRLTGEFDKSLALDALTLERRTATLGSEHPRTLDSAMAVARDLLEAGRYSEAVTQMTAVWTRCRAALGDNDRATLNAQVLLGVAQRCAGRPDLAQEHFDQARQGLIRGFGRDSSDALAARLSTAVNLLALSKIQDARTSAQEVLAIHEARIGPSHPHSLICKVNIATALCLQEDYEPALSTARSAAAGLDDRLGAAHPYTLAANMVTAAVLASQGNLAEASVLEGQTAAGLARVLGQRHPDTLRCQANMLLTRHESTGGESAERQAIIDQLTALLGPQHPDIGTLTHGGRLFRMIDPQPF